ncbi:MAG: hypothetical protein WCD69_15670, partial [Xanthobacteraceae bacterium]
ARFDYEYERNGTANLFMMFAPLEGWRHVKVTDRHTAVDYHSIRWLLIEWASSASNPTSLMCGTAIQLTELMSARPIRVIGDGRPVP